jgi:hypothetical protein
LEPSQGPAGKLHLKVEAKPDTLEAMAHNEHIQAARGVHLNMLLAEAIVLARDFEGLWENAQQTDVIIITVGERGVMAQTIDGNIMNTCNPHVAKPQ